jgi:hypothetical protein
MNVASTAAWHLEQIVIANCFRSAGVSVESFVTACAV